MQQITGPKRATLSGAMPTSFRHVAVVSLCFYNIRRSNIFSRQQCDVSDTVKTFVGISVFDGGKIEESEGYNSFFVVFYVLESK